MRSFKGLWRAEDFTWHTRVFEALRDEDWLIQRSRLITSADKLLG